MSIENFFPSNQVEMSFPNLGFSFNILFSQLDASVKSLCFWAQLKGTILHDSGDYVLSDYAYNIQYVTNIYTYLCSGTKIISNLNFNLNLSPQNTILIGTVLALTTFIIATKILLQLTFWLFLGFF